MPAIKQPGGERLALHHKTDTMANPLMANGQVFGALAFSTGLWLLRSHFSPAREGEQ